MFRAGMFAGWGGLVHQRRWVVVTAVLVATLAGGAWGVGLFGRLSQGGYTDTASQSARASALADAAFGQQTGDVVVLYTAPPGHTVDEGAAAAARVLHGLPRSAARAEVSYWDTHSPRLVTA